MIHHRALTLDRRGFLRGGLALAGLGMMSACSRIAGRAQRTDRPRLIGFLNSETAPPGPIPGWEALWKQLAELGWSEGQNLIVEYRHAGGSDERLRDQASELVELGVELIVTWTTPEAVAAQQATSTIPIVGGGADPLRQGLVASLARPGGNFTGVANFDIELNAKRIELLKECVPTVKRVLVVIDARGRGTPMGDGHRAMIDRSAAEKDIGVIYGEVSDPNEVPTTLNNLLPRQPDALYVAASPFFSRVEIRPMIADLAIRHRLPTVSNNLNFVRSGLLLSYSADDLDLRRRQAILIDKVLRGANPAELPIERSSKYVLGVNLKTAEALGVTVPARVLEQATEVIR